MNETQQWCFRKSMKLLIGVMTDSNKIECKPQTITFFKLKFKVNLQPYFTVECVKNINKHNDLAGTNEKYF